MKNEGEKTKRKYSEPILYRSMGIDALIKRDDEIAVKFGVYRFPGKIGLGFGIAGILFYAMVKYKELAIYALDNVRGRLE